ncbi:MAG: hypothetical protein ACKN9T_00135 [Candidatus Methylumidiphilus sp.]
MNRKIILAIALAGFSATASAYSYNAQTGALSYTFFNLSPNPWTLTPYGAGANPSSQSVLFTGNAPMAGNGGTTGWQNSSGTVGFFNSTKISGGSCGNPSQQVQSNVIFYNENADPISAPSGSTTLPIGTQHNVVEYSTAISSTLNAPSVGDSWTLTGNSTTAVLAGMASAPNMFISGIEGGNDYPYCASSQGLWYNDAIYPPSAFAPYPSPSPIATPAGNFFQYPNPGAGFVTETMNFNVASSSPGYLPTGGLWLGGYNPNTGNLALNSLNLSMYPINLATYTQSNDVNTGIGQYVTPIYGGHFTLSIGDPYLVSSYAAKILWYVATNNNYAFSNASLSTIDLQNLQNLVVPPGANGVFVADSTSSQYAAWLLASPGLAQTAVSTMNTAASKPITHESIWGKVINNTLKLATNVGIASIGMIAGPEASVGLEMMVSFDEGLAETGSGAVGADYTDAITAAFTSTVSQPPPVSQIAPPIINGSYSAANLLGMLLANSFVQAEINNAEGLGNISGFALWSNDSINTDGLCATGNSSGAVSVGNNLIGGACYTTNSSGALTAATVTTGSQPTATQSYTNVLSTYPNSQSATKINVWDAVLTGSDITTVQNASVANNGYMQVANPTIAAFSPPTQLVNQTGVLPLAISGVNTTFNLSTGMISLASYIWAAPSGTTPAPRATPVLNVYAGTMPMPGWGIYFMTPTYVGGAGSGAAGTYSYAKGVMTVYGYYVYNNMTLGWYANSFSNGPQTLDMTTCPSGASANLFINANPNYGDGSQSSGALVCSEVFVPTLSAASGTYPKPATQPAIATFNTAMPANSATAFRAPTNPALASAGLIGYSPTTGLLTVTGYGYANANGTSTASFYNGPQTLDMTTCAPGSGVNLTVYPIQQTSGATPGSEALGYLTCQSPPTLPYNACTNDPNATGGIIAAVTAANGSSATFQLGCACVPSYLGGPSSGTTLGGVIVGATSTNPTAQCN